MSSVLLPADIEQFKNVFGNSNIKSIFTMSRILEFSPAQETVWKYSGRSLVAGRPLNSAIILMAGPSGSGKSSTVNFLFDDHSLCPTSSISSQTREAVLIEKEILVPLQKLNPITGYLCFIDVPGSFDTNVIEKANNLAKIQKAKNSVSRLQPRSYPSPLQSHLRNDVYPNIILFVAKATDDFKSEMFRKALRTLDGLTNVVDKKLANVIVVLTHCMSLAYKKENFETKLRDYTGTIQNQFELVLKLKNVAVVPVENFPAEHNLPIRDGFYKLPNGDLSHHNLYQAMEKRLNENEDLLGRLIVGRYFGATCIEKKQPATVIKLDTSISPDDITIAELSLADVDAADANSLGEIYRFGKLGFGFCPVTEKTKFSSLLKQQAAMSLKLVKLNDVKYRIPSFIVQIVQNKIKYNCQGYVGKLEYQHAMKTKYALESNLRVTNDARRKWISETPSENETGIISFVQEFPLAKFVLDPSEKTIYSENFMKNLRALPDQYNSRTAEKFRAFFSLWGTHWIYKITVGGYIRIDCSIKSHKVDSEKLSEIRKRPQTTFNWLANGRVDEIVEGEIEYLNDFDITSVCIQLEGGVSPLPTNFTKITPEQVDEWKNSIAMQPVEFQRTKKLYPYYNLLLDNDTMHYEALREATNAYIEGNLERTLQKIRDDMAAEAVKSVEERSSNGCFPKGTTIRCISGNCLPIEKIQYTINPQILTFPTKYCSFKCVKIDIKEDVTSFVTFLHRETNQNMRYLEIEFTNGKTLVVSGSHLVFQFIKSKSRVTAIQAKYFKLGDQVIFLGANGVEYPVVKQISEGIYEGVYCPLTASGTFFADGFFVTSYAHTESFLLAQAIMAPLKATNYFKHKLASKDKSGTSSDSLRKTSSSKIHPYAKNLLALRDSLK